MQRRSLFAALASLLGFAVTARAEEQETPTHVLIASTGALLYVRYTDDGVEIRPGQVAPMGGRNLLVVPPNPEEWTESKARALSLGEAALQHIQNLHDSGKTSA